MPLLNIDLMTPDGVLFEGNEIPDDLQSEELVSRLVNTLSLPRATASGELIKYSLEIVNQGVRLQSGQTLGDAGATNGDVIRLLSSHKIQKPSEFKKPSELKPPRTPVVAGAPAPDDAHTASTYSGAVIIIPVRGSNASVTKTLNRLRDSLGIRPEDVAVLNPSTSRLKAPVSSAVKPSLLGVSGNYRTAMLAGMAVVSLLFLMFAISSKNKTESIAQAKEPSSTSTSIPTPTPIPVEPTPRPTPEPTLQPTPEPTPKPKKESLWLAPQKPVTQAKSEAMWMAGILQRKPTPAPKAQNPPTKLPEVSKPSSMILAPNVNNKMPERLKTTPRLNTTPIIIAMAREAPPEAPEDPKKCGMWRKMMVGCKDKKPKKSKNGGAAGVVESATESKAKATIRRGVGRAIP